MKTKRLVIIMLVLFVALLTAKAALSFPGPLPRALSGQAQQLQAVLQNTNPSAAQAPALTLPPGTALDKVITKLTNHPVDIIKIEVGDSPATLRNYADYALTYAFNPGEEVFFRLTIKNKLTAATPAESVANTIENIELSAQTSLAGFPVDLLAVGGPYFLAPEDERAILFSYTLPINTAAQAYPISFKITGTDLQNPPLSYETVRSVNLNVTRDAHELRVSTTHNDIFTCAEKQNVGLQVSLANSGSTTEAVTVRVEHLYEVRPTVVPVAPDQQVTLLPGQERQLSFTLPSAAIVSGTAEFEVVVYRTSVATLEYFREQFEIELANCVPTFQDFPTPLTFAEGASTTLDLSQYVLDREDVNGEDTFTFTASVTQNLVVDIVNDHMTVGPVSPDWFGTEDFTLTVSDGTAQATQTVQVVVTQLFDEAITITSMTTPSEVMRETESFDFTIVLSNPDAIPVTYTWYVDDQAQTGATAATFHFRGSAFSTGTHAVKVVVNEDEDIEVEAARIITTADRPVDLTSFEGQATTTPSQITNPQSVPAFTLENAFGKIAFSQNVDLSDIVQLAPLAVIQSNRVAINSTAAPELNKPATITLFGSFVLPVIMKSFAFNAGPFVTCPATECQLVSNANGQVTFTVTGFSTYQVQEQPSVGVEAVEGEVFFDQALRNQSATVNITVRNSGANQNLTGLTAEFVGVAAKYAPQISGLPATLAVGAQATITVQVAVPVDEVVGKHTLGTLKIKSDQIETSVPITILPKSFLTISKFEVNGKSSGDLELNAVNKISATVKNEYTQDMEDVTVTITILDVDGEDLEEEVDSFDLNDGDDEEVTVEFDLIGERLEEEKYTVKVTVEGTAEDDNTEHQAEFTQEVEVERENHKVVLQRADASSTLLKCTRQTTLSVVVENVGKNDEGEVEVRISNSILGISQNRADIELDAFDGTDNEYKTSFPLNLQNAAAGNYPITVNVYRDGDVVDTKEVVFTVETCTAAATGTATGTQTVTTTSGVTDDLARQIQQQIQQRAQQQAVTEPVSALFRDSREYGWLLGGVVVLLVLAVVLGLALLVKRR